MLGKEAVCDNCMYWDKSYNYCRYLPPKVIVQEQYCSYNENDEKRNNYEEHVLTVWPIAYSNEWCGLWRERI